MSRCESEAGDGCDLSRCVRTDGHDGLHLDAFGARWVDDEPQAVDPRSPQGLAAAQDLIDTVCDLLCGVACGLRVEPEHLVRGLDPSLSYCRRCAEKVVEEQRAKDPDGEYETDYSGPMDADSIPSCQECGVTLDAPLTDHGIENELDHYLDHEPDLSNDFDCYVVLKLIYDWRHHPRAIELAQRILDRSVEVTK